MFKKTVNIICFGAETMITFLLSDSGELTFMLLTEECSEGFVFMLY